MISGFKFKNFSELKEAVAAAFRECVDESEREIKGGKLYSRGKYIRIIKGEETVAGEADSWPWDGTLKSLESAIEVAKYQHRADYLAIDGGLDWALNPAAKADGDYDPLVNDWSVIAWEKVE
jgi:gamma-glutamylcyclotransferase (GGCT)/AIG2-like uncharacterized protein YtfP